LNHRWFRIVAMVICLIKWSSNWIYSLTWIVFSENLFLSIRHRIVWRSNHDFVVLSFVKELIGSGNVHLNHNFGIVGFNRFSTSRCLKCWNCVVEIGSVKIQFLFFNFPVSILCLILNFPLYFVSDVGHSTSYCL
jgi:hypothetical protein